MRWLALFMLLALPAAGKPVSDERVLKVLPEFDRYVEKGRQDWKVPAFAYIVVRQDKVLHFQGFGQKGPDDPEPPDPDTLWAIGSTTKAFAAATLAQCVDQGAFQWDTRVVDLYPDFQMYDPWVTREFRVADLLAQHSGMPPYSLTAYGMLGYTSNDIVYGMRLVRPVSSFRFKFAYVNDPHLVAGLIVAKDWGEFLRERILDPLDMSRTSWSADDFNHDGNRAVGYALVDRDLTPAEAVHFPYVFGPAGALNSTARDMARWVQLQLGNGSFQNQQVVSARNLEVTRTPQTPISRQVAYAMGWVINYSQPHPIVWHNGGTPGHRTMVAFIPEEDLGIVLFTNTGVNDLADAAAFRFFDLIYDRPVVDYSANLLEQFTQRQEAIERELQPPAGAFPARPLSAYAGLYQGELLGRVRVTAEQGQLRVRLQRPGVEAVLEPYSGDVFVLRMTTPWLVQAGITRVGKWIFSQGSKGPIDQAHAWIGDQNEGTDTWLYRVEER